jgi:hypothetical protein
VPGLFDLIQSAMGHPDPAMAIQARLGQAPGMPGGPGPQPLVGPPPPGPPAGPDGSPGASGGPAAPAQQQQQQAPPPQPQAYQTPPDLGGMFVQLMQRQQSNEQFNRGIGMLAAGFAAPRDRETMINAMSGQSGDAGGLMGKLMQLQQWNIQQQRYGDMQKSLPALAQATGLPVETLTAMFNSNPETFGQEIARVQEAKLGLTGTQTDKEFRNAQQAWQAQNPGQPLPTYLQTEAGFGQWQVGKVTEEKAKADDVVKARGDFTTQNQQFGQAEGLANKLLNASDDTLGEITKTLLPATGVGGVLKSYTGQLSDEGGQAASDLQNLKNLLYSKAFQSTGSRRTQQEVQNLSNAISQLDNANLTPKQLRDQIANVQTMLRQTHANTYGAAGQAVPDDLYDLMDPIYKKEGDTPGDLYAGAVRMPKPKGGGPSAPASVASAGPAAAAPAASAAPNVPNAKKAPDGNWYVPDPARPGKYLRVD